MKQLTYFFLTIAFSFNVIAANHEDRGTSYGLDGAASYATHKHGADGDILLDPYFIPFLEQSSGLKLIDVGCGAGPWAIYAAKQEAHVTCLDIQANMIQLAEINADQENIDNIEFVIADAANLPYPTNSFERSISINVGCNIPTSQDTSKGLAAHFNEIARVLKPYGKLIVTAPANFDVVFSTNQSSEQTLYQINEALNNIPNDVQAEDITAYLNQLDHVLRATFKLKDGQLMLVTDEKQLTPGDKIWRKIPGLTVPNFYHPESEYLEAAKKSGLTLVSSQKPKFISKQQWLAYNEGHTNDSGLSEAYIDHYPFIIFEFEKQVG